MATRGFKEHMAAFQDKMFKTPSPEERLKPWTSADIARFAAAHPKEGSDLQTLRSAGMFCGLGGLAGAGAGGAIFFSRPGTVKGKFFSAVLGNCLAFSHHLVRWVAERGALFVILAIFCSFAENRA